MPSMIGGALIEGGWINQSAATDTIGGSPWKSGYARGIPIRQCELPEQWNERPLFIAGLLGCPTTRRISFQSQFSFNIWFDEANPIEVAIPIGGAPGVGKPSFRQRDPFQLVFVAGYSPATNTYHKAYFAPRAVADIITPIWDSESDPRKCIGQSVLGHTRGYTFLLPDDGEPDNAATVCGAYCAYLFNNPRI